MEDRQPMSVPPSILYALSSILLLLPMPALGQDATHLCDFETPDDIKAWEINAGQPKLVQTGVAHGKSALEIRFDPKGPYHPAYMSWNRVRGDWSGFDALVLDVTNPSDQPMPATLLIGDKAWASKGRSYWNRHNAGRVFAPGHSRWVIPLGGLYRGEAGSRNGDIKANIDPSSIVRLDFGFGVKGTEGSVIIDDLRLVKFTHPAGVWAFDFGPPDQSVQPGWTAISNATAYNKKQGFGWSGGPPWDGAARDTTFGPAMLRDFCEAGGYRFRIDVPAGKYAVTVWFENSGYWGGEEAMHTWRRVLVEGKEVWKETRPDGPAHALYRFEDVEPVGKDIWDTYMKDELAKPAKFEVAAGADGLTLQFEADRTWGSKVAGLVVHRADDADAAKWVSGQMDDLAAEFREMAVCLDPPAKPYDAPAEWKGLGAVAWPVEIDQEITPNSLPVGQASSLSPDDEDKTETGKMPVLRYLATRGEMATFSCALRPTQPLGQSKIAFEWTKAPAKLPGTVSRTWYSASRGFNSISYHLRPFTVRPCAEVDLADKITRQFIVTVPIPADAAPGDYEGRLTIAPNAGKPITIPVRLKVSRFVLDRQTDFAMGFFGLMPPEMVPQDQRQAALEQTLEILKQSGMNMVCGGPNFRLTGWKDGQPQIDFTAADNFMALLPAHGFTGPVNGYGGPRFIGLHDGYEKGAAAAKVEKASGLPYEEALMRAWKAVDEHARAKNWATIWYAMCDETRVRDVAERELEFMKLMAKVSAAFPKTVRTSGSYSVSFNKRPTDPNDMAYWHQQFFAALDISDLNLHDPSVMDEAAKTGKQVHIYNQGTSRYSFGLYQFGEFRKGVTARTQWHLNVLHGYQFFDLDGREPDTAMICYGRNAIYPTIELERCREGAQDFYLYNMLAKAVEQARKDGKKGPAIDAAAVLLDQLLSGVKLNQREPPAGYDPEKLKAQVIAALEGM